MGNTSTQLTRAERIAQIAGISNQEFINLHRQFQYASGEDMKLDYCEFVRFYSNLTGIGSYGVDNQVMAERLFQAIDLDNNQYISFEEFIIAYILIANPGEPLNTKIQKFLACYFGGYIPIYINPSDAFKIQQSLNILCGVPTGSQPMYQTSHMGQSQMMGQGMHMGGQGMHMGGQGMHSGGVGAHMRGHSHSGGYQQMNGMPREQFIQSIIGNPGYTGYFATSSNQTNPMGYMPQMNQSQIMDQRMHLAGQGFYSNGMIPKMYQHSRSGGYQQMNGIPREQFIQSIIGNPGYTSY